MNFEDIKQRLLALDTACVCDGNKVGTGCRPHGHRVKGYRSRHPSYPNRTQTCRAGTHSDLSRRLSHSD